MTEKMRSNMAVNIIGAIVILLILFGIIVSAQGYISFTNAFKKEYATSTYHMADTATTLVNGDHLEAYLAGEETGEYERTVQFLDAYCRRMSVSLIYVILVDQSDYGRFVSVFNAVDNTVDDTSYTVWELGHKRDTTNVEYQTKYKAIYDQAVPYETVYRTSMLNGQNPHITTMVPVKNSEGDVAAILCMQRPIRELHDARQPYLRRIGIVTLVLAFLSSVFAAVYIRNNFVEPIQQVSAEATRFAKENTIGEPLGEISNYEEILNLASSIDTMETDMVQYIENLTAATAERERISAELSVASTIQENAIPNVFPAFPDRTEFDIYASMTPAKEVGGDFYNFFLLDDDHLLLVIGDVSGKGIPGALFMMVTNILITDRAKMGGTPAEILTYVNDSLFEHNRADMFVTLWLGILEISTGKMTAACAGHDDAAVYRRGGAFELFKTKHGLVAGAMDGIRYKDFETVLGEGDKLFLYTDGVPEATDSEDKMFTMDRMVEALNTYKEERPQGILEGVHKAVNDFVGDAPQFDDLTMLCIELKGRA